MAIGIEAEDVETGGGSMPGPFAFVSGVRVGVAPLIGTLLVEATEDVKVADAEEGCFFSNWRFFKGTGIPEFFFLAFSVESKPLAKALEGFFKGTGILDFCFVAFSESKPLANAL